MAVKFVAYIDESGDTGLQKVRTPDDPIGASEWLILSCLIVSIEECRYDFDRTKRTSKASQCNVVEPLIMVSRITTVTTT
jgi:hypothetical protein